MGDNARVRYTTPFVDNSRWDGFELRADDIIIAVPAKSGTTWLQMICALLIFQTPDLERPLSSYSPWYEQLIRPRQEVEAELVAQTHRRFIKTHTPVDGLPTADGVTFVTVGRDPRDVMLSSRNHGQNLAPTRDRRLELLTESARVDGRDQPVMPAVVTPPSDVKEHFRAWVESEAPDQVFALKTVLTYLQGFWDARSSMNVVILHYDDLKADLEGQMRALASRLGIEVPAKKWPSLVKAATFDEMRANADRLAPNAALGLWESDQRFFNKGTTGQWRELLLDEADMRRYWQRVAELCTPELAAWVHREPPPSA